MRCSGIGRGEEFRDVLPFPLSHEPGKAEIDLCMAAGQDTDLQPDLIRQAGKEAWLFLIRWALNFLQHGRKPCNRVPSCMSEAQGIAMKRLEEYVDSLLSGPPIPVENWEEVLRSSKLDYNIEEAKLPETVTWDQLELALPPAGSAGKVRALELAE